MINEPRDPAAGLGYSLGQDLLGVGQGQVLLRIDQGRWAGRSRLRFSFTDFFRASTAVLDASFGPTSCMYVMGIPSRVRWGA